ncbi:ABC transporter permease [Acidisoma sp. S159]|uniref:ABC transporter permease n=1 Tax=Acidisoma sp. S159 TaxID=1747225 RepID=UPI00131A9A52|nr:ABC transporter permease [Acidisoma sp. S159]
MFRGSLINILFQTSVVGVLALGETLVMLTGGIDLSIVATMVVTAIVIGGGGSEQQQEMSMSNALPYLGFWLAILVGLAGSIFVGLINGIVIVRFRIPAFIATLAMSLVLAGVALLLTGGAPIYYPDPFFANFVQAKLLHMPYPVWSFIALLLSFGLSRSRIGLMVYALGGNNRAARLSGIPVRRVTILMYTLCGLYAGIGGFLFLARTGSVAPDSGGSFLLTTIASVVVGGVSLAGGAGSVKNAFFGILLLASLSNLMNILLISPHIQDAVSGVIILVALAVNARVNPA